MILLPNPQAICTGQQLAEVLGVTPRQIDRLRASGVLKPVRCKAKGRYRLGDSVQSYLRYRDQYVTERLKVADDAYNKARAKRMAAMGAMAELELSAKRGQYLYKPDVEFHLSTLLQNCRDRILAIPSRTMHSLVGRTNAMECNKIVGDEVNLALNEIADQRCFDWQRMRKDQIAFLQGEGFSEEQAEEMAGEMQRRREARADRNGEMPA
jgi:phage terminase Nu1 subunit (DNA packaging protein)